MRRGDVRRHVSLLLLAVALLVGLASPSPAHAQEVPPAPAGQKTPVPEPLAVETAKKECVGFILDPALWAAAAPTLGQSILGTQRVCEDGVKASLVSGDRQMGARAACESGAGPVFDSVSVKAEVKEKYFTSCAEKLGPIMLKAWEVAQPSAAAKGDAVEKVDQAVCAMTEGIPCVMKQLATWMTNELGKSSGDIGKMLAEPTRATRILNVFNTAEGERSAEQRAFAEIYLVLGGLAASIALVAFLISLITGVVQRSGRPVAEGLTGLATWGLLWVTGLTVATLILTAADGIAQQMLGATDGGRSQIDVAIDKVFQVLISSANPMTGGLFSILALVIFAGAILGMFVNMALREVSLLLVALMLPVLLALRAAPGSARKMLMRSLATFITLALAKPLLIVVLRFSSAVLLAPGRGLGGLFIGLITLCIAAFAPQVAYSLFGMKKESGAGHATTGASATGVTENAVNSGQSLRNMVGGGSPAMKAGGGKAAGGLGKVAGPVGIALTAATMAAGAMKSGAQSVASGVGTGGGVLGETEKPHLPTAPHKLHGGGAGGRSAGGRQDTPKPTGPRPGSHQRTGPVPPKASPASGSSSARPSSTPPARTGGVEATSSTTSSSPSGSSAVLPPAAESPKASGPPDFFSDDSKREINAREQRANKPAAAPKRDFFAPQPKINGGGTQPPNKKGK